jgi:hypothetical protein
MTNRFMKNLIETVEIVAPPLVGMAVVIGMGAGLLWVNSEINKTIQNSMYKSEIINQGIEVQVSKSPAGRRVLVHDTAYGPGINPGISALDYNKDGRFDEMHIQVEKGSKLERYVSLSELENLYNHAAEFGKDMREK